MTAPANEFGHFGNPVKSVPETEGIKYAGSKLKLLPHILDLALEVGAESVFDAFSGTTRVSQAFARNGYSVISSDISEWSETFAKCYLQGGNPRKYHDLVEHLNSVRPLDGWFTEHYGGCPDSVSTTKRPWQRHNTRKLDGIRAEIDRIDLTGIEKSVALTSLVLALDRVDSAVGHFSSYLKDWSPRSYNSLQLKIPRIVPGGNGRKHRVRKGDAFETAKKITADLAYLDPPYGSSNEKMPPSRVRYASYYHLWTTVILNDRPELFGAANRRVDSRDAVAASVFEEFKTNEDGRFKAVLAIENLIREIRAEHVILSYGFGGRATSEELRNAISNVGEVVSLRKIDHGKNVMSRMKWTGEWTSDIRKRNIEYLFLIRKHR